MTVASSHITSRQHAKVYLYYMKQYVEGLKQMFHKFKLHPNHHMALHLQEYLIQYGPVHSWWTFPFERLIGLIQRIPSNGKPGTYAVGSNLSPLITNRLLGEYEESISKSYSRVANFRALLQKAGCPQAIQYCRPFLEKLINPQNRGTLVTDIRHLEVAVLPDDENVEEDTTSNSFKNPGYRSSSAKQIPDDLLAILRRRLRSGHRRLKDQATFANHIVLEGLNYSTTSCHSGNANVFIREDGQSDIHAAKIAHILHFEQHSVILVRPHLPVPIMLDNPFHEYPVLQGSIWSCEVGELLPIDAGQIVCHFAELRTSWEDANIIITLALNRVSAAAAIIHSKEANKSYRP